MKAKKQAASSSHLWRDSVSLILLALAVFIFLCLVSYSPTDPGWTVQSTVPHLDNLGGRIGAYSADILIFLLGPSAYFVCIAFAALALMGFGILRSQWSKSQMAGVIVFALSAPIFGSLVWGTLRVWNKAVPFGGVWGQSLAESLVAYANHWGSLLFVSVVMLVSGMLITGRSVRLGVHCAFDTLPRFLVRTLTAGSVWVSSKVTILWARFCKWWRGRQKTAAKSPVAKPVSAAIAKPSKLISLLNWISFKRSKTVVPSVPVAFSVKPLSVAKSAPAVIPPSPPSTPVAEKRLETFEELSAEVKIYKRKEDEKKKAADKADQLDFLPAVQEGCYILPPLSLLDTPEEKHAEISEQSLRANAQLLESKLRDFAVEGAVTEIHPGPVITMYEFVPAPGVKINKIVNLVDDLSLAMEGRQVRIVAPLPDKAAVGLEIPNNDRETVWLKDILAHPKFKAEKSKLLFALGKDISGDCFVADLTKMPHLLVAGATGAGKSVSVNTMILSLLYQATPEECRLIMVDPKMLELSVYQGIPHLLLPVVTDPKKAAKALRWAVKEMERRYQLMADLNARNIINYNKRIEKGEHAGRKSIVFNGTEIVHDQKLPYIVIIIDELADLMMVAGKEVEECITRLAQMARAAGIHLILATQRPSVDVLTGVIKANFPSRISFKVSSRYDSRTILDNIGAENLLGAGDMLFLPPGTSRVMRIHGAYVSENEIGRVVDFLKQQGTPQYREEEILTQVDDISISDEPEAIEDDLYDAAVGIVSETRQASISMVQRRLRIGYNRAARLIERMEAEGVVSRPNGAKGREVLLGEIR